MYPRIIFEQGLETGLKHIFLFFALVIALRLTIRVLIPEGKGVEAEVVGYQHFWEPGWLLGLRFVRDSSDIIRDGYRKVSKIPIQVASDVSEDMTSWFGAIDTRTS